MTIDYVAVIRKFDRILARGLSRGLGDRDGQMCIEAALSAALGLPHGDHPACVAPIVRDYKISLNDKSWSSPRARARGLRDLGIAQIGSAGIDQHRFVTRLTEQTIRVLIPTLFRELFPRDTVLLAAALRCEQEGTAKAAYDAAEAVSYYAYAYAYAYDASDAALAAAARDAAIAVKAAVFAEAAVVCRSPAATPDRYLRLSASICLDVLRELKCPGCDWVQ